jgi:hypothetical protein
MVFGNKAVLPVMLVALCALSVPGLGAEGLPDGVSGFSGRARGVVQAVNDDGTVMFKVFRVLQTWKNNEARKPELLVGRTVKVGPRIRREGELKGKPDPLCAAFLKTLEAGREITLALRNVPAGDTFEILELTREQRAAAKGEGEGVREGDGGKEGGAEARRVEELKGAVSRLERMVVELRQENERLKEENAALREKLGAED